MNILAPETEDGWITYMYRTGRGSLSSILIYQEIRGKAVVEHPVRVDLVELAKKRALKAESKAKELKNKAKAT